MGTLKRTYKQTKQTEKVITEPTLSVFQCNSRWKSSNKGNCKFTTYLNVVILYTVPYFSMYPYLSLLAQPKGKSLSQPKKKARKVILT